MVIVSEHSKEQLAGQAIDMAVLLTVVNALLLQFLHFSAAQTHLNFELGK